MNYYNLDIDDVLGKLGTNKEGLKNNEVENRLKKYGKNKLETPKKQSKLKKFLYQFKDLMIIILILSSIISFILSVINKESFTDSAIILLIVIINAIVGYMQELKADRALEELKKLQTTKTKVKRNGKLIEINSEEVVVGDILILEAGDTVPADARIIYEASLKCDESSLTGESNNISKTSFRLDEHNLPLSSRKNMIYSGTNITYGKCRAVVTNTGMNTEFGLIAKTLNEEPKEITPLERKINDISKFLSIIIFIIIFVMFIIGLIKGIEITEVIMLSISLAVAAIPEGLPAVITITLSLGVSSMSKKKAIVRKLSSVETLGCTEVICSDKTGTITQNKMTVVGVYFDNKLIDSKEKINNDLLEIMALNNDVEKSNDKYIGDSTEIALYNICEEHLINIKDLRDKYTRIDELPFDSDRKMMSTINKYDECIKILTKGSFDSIINCCTKIYENGNIDNLNENKKQELKNKEKELSNKAYRILAFAFKEIKSEYNLDNLENELIFVGMSLMIDPPRLDVKESINECKLANIKPIMITGDSLDTAIAISKEIGILSDRSEAITGIEIDKLSKEELKEKVKNYSVYARVSPINKLQIVNAWKENNIVVAMTGDGVNDAPALKKADIGIGMGITGTEVSKNVSDIILADDSFSTIVTAVEEGRRIYDNIRNVLVYLITGNIAEVLVVFIGMLFGIEIFLPIQLLYINLITDSIPAIALSFEEGSNDIMNRKVKNTTTFFTPFLLAKIFLSSLLKTIVILFVYFTSVKIYGVSTAISMSFLCLILLEMVFAFTCRNLKKNIIFEGMFKNKVMNKSMIILILIQLLIFTTPLKSIFNISNLSFFQVIYSVIMVLTIFLIDELTKNLLVKIFKD